MADRFSLSSGLAHELELAFRRTDWTAEEVKKLTGGNLLARIREVVLGQAEIHPCVAAPPPKISLFQTLGTVVIPATPTPFVARDAFVSTGRKVQAKIVWLGSNFKEWFLDKIEEPMAETALRYGKLLRPEIDETILVELGETKETTLGQIFYLMSLQSSDKKGVLLTDGWANVFYVIDVLGVFRAVNVYWDDDGWSVGAFAVDDPYRWYDEGRFFSRNSLPLVAVAV